MFEKIIGYENEKGELAKFCDVIININYYKSLGIRIPKGIILYGEPGLGKTTFAYSIIEACNVPYYILRKNADSAQFIANMREVFENAKNNAPSIILLDDMDKFGNGDKYAPEYTSLQGAIDDYKQYDIFIIGTVNDMFVLPTSLTRVGRFDRLMMISNPVSTDSFAISNYYLDSKSINLDPSINRNLLGKLFEGYSCATIETIINMAAMSSVYEHNQYITIDNIIDTILNIVYSKPKVVHDNRSWEEKYRLAIYEAGKAVVTYLLHRDYLSIVTIIATNYALATDKSSTNSIKKTSLYPKSSEKYMDANGKSFQDRLNDVAIVISGMICFEMKFNAFATMDEAYEDQSVAMMVADDLAIVTCSEIPNVIIKDTTPKLVNGKLQNDNKNNRIYRDDIYKYCVEYTRNILAANWNYIECIARALMEKTTITVYDIDNIMNGNIYLQSNNSGTPMFRNLIE